MSDPTKARLGVVHHVLSYPEDRAGVARSFMTLDRKVLGLLAWVKVWGLGFTVWSLGFGV